MNTETIVAVFDSETHAAAAAHDLEEAGVPASSIDLHANETTERAGAMGENRIGSLAAPEPSFWSSLFGGDPEHGHDTTVYARSLESGSTILTVKTEGASVDKAMEILERHDPVDIDQRAADYREAAASSTQAAPTSLSTSGGTTASAGDETIKLAEEALVVGKRAINRGTTRVRRYVVTTPVEEQVDLHAETVSVERRPVTDGDTVADADFSEKVIEVNETGEEAVVSKTARVKEEVVIRKAATEHSETVRDTVRREDVEITKEGSADPASAGAGTASVSGPLASKI